MTATLATVTAAALQGEWVANEEGGQDFRRVRRDAPVQAELRIRPVGVPDFLKRVERFKKIAARHGQVVDAVRGEDVLVEHPFRRNKKQVRQVWTVTVPPMVGVKGRVIGHFDRAEDGKSQYVHVFAEGERAACEALVHRAGQCDHCGLKRDRIATFVVEHDGATKLVGKNCLVDYLGVDPGWALAAAEWFDGERDTSNGGGGCGANFVNLMDVVEAAFKVARKQGGYPTGDDRYWFRGHVAVLVFGAHNEEGARIQREYASFDPGPLDLEALADYVERASGDFGQNLRIALEQDVIATKRTALVIAGVAMWVGRTLKRDAEPAAPAPAEPVAFDEPEGTRFVFEAEVTRITVRQGDFGITRIIGLRTADGRCAVNFHTGANVPEAGKRYRVKATVKKHQPAFRGIGRETVLSRAVYETV